MLKKKKYSDGCIDYPGVGVITDEDVYKLVKEHTRPMDRLDMHKVSDNAIAAQLILMKVVEPPEANKNGKWYF